mgnify:CR=1 FL=1
MNPAIGLALLSLAAAGCLDVVFKGYSRKTRSRGMYVFVCGLVWSILQVCLFLIQGVEPSFGTITLGYGIVAGLLLALANILLIESLTFLDVSLGSTVYRLNTIGVVILSFLLLDEPLGFLKTSGVLCGVFAVYMLYDRKPQSGSANPFQAFLWVAIAASLLRAVFGIVSKAGLQAGADANAMLLIYSLSWVACGLSYACLREKRIRLTRKKMAYGIFSGVLLSVVANALILALKVGEVGVVVPIANLSFIVALLISSVIGMETLNVRKGVAIAGAVLSILLLAKSV